MSSFRRRQQSDDIRVVVGIDFGTTNSGFAYTHKISQEIETNTQWPGKEGSFKTDTVLLYNSDCTEVLNWGAPALVHLGSSLPPQHHTIERFKLFLDDNASDKPYLPPNLDYRKAISDYLNKMKEVIKETLDKRWPGLKLSQVQFVLCVPAEWGPHTKAIMRDCAYRAGLLDESIESHLEFTTGPEAAVIHCLSVIKEHKLKEG
ncbi:1867_t:CDS:2, partial [Racocetra persica]